MKNIAIFVSGKGEAAERVVKLFNEGNRVHTSLVVVDDSATPLLENLKEEDVTLMHIPDSEWQERYTEVAEKMKEQEVRLLVLDNFDEVIPDEIMEVTEGELIRLTSPEMAPREVVNALEADLRKPIEEKKEEVVSEENPTPESEWADALKIQFTPPKVPVTPPDVPQENVQPQTENGNFQPFNPFNYRRNNEPKREENTEPMPSTWLIWSILATVFCCFIPGIIAIIFSSMVSSKYYMRDIEGSRRASRMAEIWIIVSVVLGVVAATLYLPFMLIGS